MKISVVICTWNNANMLHDTLASIKQALSNAKAEIEILVVNNNSTDSTEKVIASWMCKLNIRSIFESNPGLSNARNTAINNITGEFIIWTDDDVIVDKNWLSAYEHAFKIYPKSTFFGGPILPKVESTPPNWFKSVIEKIPYVYSILDQGNGPFQILRETQLPFGANFAVRSSVQNSFRYDPNLGRQPSCLLLAGEEAVFLNSLVEANHQGWWIPNAIVMHRLPKKRLTIRYLIKHGIGLGRTIVRTDNQKDIDSFESKFIPILAKLKIFLVATKKTFYYLLKKSSNHWIPALHNASVQAGKLYEVTKLICLKS